ncbi:MAG: hypothetical protein AAFP07_13085 [Cyanobacteria bacterium J06606_4]
MEDDVDRQRELLALEKNRLEQEERRLVLEERQLDLLERKERIRAASRQKMLESRLTVAKILNEFWIVIAGALVLIAGIFLVTNDNSEDNDIGMMLLGAGTGTAGTGAVVAQRDRPNRALSEQSQKARVGKESNE